MKQPLGFWKTVLAIIVAVLLAHIIEFILIVILGLGAIFSVHPAESSSVSDNVTTEQVETNAQ